jgi:hypothetical protein
MMASPRFGLRDFVTSLSAMMWSPTRRAGCIAGDGILKASRMNLRAGKEATAEKRIPATGLAPCVVGRPAGSSRAAGDESSTRICPHPAIGETRAPS